MDTFDAFADILLHRCRRPTLFFLLRYVVLINIIINIIIKIIININIDINTIINYSSIPSESL